MSSQSPDPRISAYLTKNRKWALSEGYKSPVKFSEMQKKGREVKDGTVIVGTSIKSGSPGLVWCRNWRRDAE